MTLPFRTIRWRLIASSLLAIGLPLIVLVFFLGSQLWAFYLRQTEGELRSKAAHVAESVAGVLDPLTPDNPAELARVMHRWTNYENIRVTVADHGGVIRAATAGTDVGSRISDHNRPGMLRALQGQANSTVWKNPDYGYEDSMYVNVPVTVEHRIVGAARVAHSLTQIQESISRIRATLIAGFAGYGLLIIVLTFILATSIVRPVEELNRSAQIIAGGDLTHRVHISGTEEIEHLGETLNQMTGRLEQLEGVRRQYVSNVSHELRTPLASIRGMAETILAHGANDPDLATRYLPRIIGQTERLARLASQLLDLAQIESGNLLGAVAPVSLQDVVDDALQVCSASAAAKGVELETEIEAGLPELSGDRDRLVQVFVNLIDNAVRYTPAGGAVRVSGRADGPNLVVMVRDDGCGIPPAHLPLVFDRFHRVEEARSARGGGTGLGLSIVRQIVDAHGGTIDVASEVGTGTSFTVRLPLLGPGGGEGGPQDTQLHHH